MEKRIRKTDLVGLTLWMRLAVAWIGCGSVAVVFHQWSVQSGCALHSL